MKKLLMGSVGLIWAYCYVQAAPPTMETPINGYGTPVTIAISSTTSTMVPSTQTTGRVGVFVAIPSTATYPIGGFMGNCTSTALAISILPIQISTTTLTSRYF